MKLSRKDIDSWFLMEVLPLEAQLTRFLRRYSRDQADILDLRQEVYAKVYEAAQTELPRFVRAFIFKTAKNLIIDKARRAQVVSIEVIADFDSVSVEHDEPNAEDNVSSRQELRALQNALDKLPPRCREVVVMRKIDGLSQRETAERLGVAESTIEKQVMKGVRRLADALYGVDGHYAGDASLRARTLRKQFKI